MTLSIFVFDKGNFFILSAKFNITAKRRETSCSAILREVHLFSVLRLPIHFNFFGTKVPFAKLVKIHSPNKTLHHFIIACYLIQSPKLFDAPKAFFSVPVLPAGAASATLLRS